MGHSFLWVSLHSLCFFIGTRPQIQSKSAFVNVESVRREVQVAVSQKATLSCEVADNRTEVKWYKDGKQLAPSRALHADSNGKIRQLVVESAERKDAGEYICEAGADKLAFKVQVTGMMCMWAIASDFLLELCVCLLNTNSYLEVTLHFFCNFCRDAGKICLL